MDLWLSRKKVQGCKQKAIDRLKDKTLVQQTGQPTDTVIPISIPAYKFQKGINTDLF